MTRQEGEEESGEHSMELSLSIDECLQVKESSKRLVVLVAPQMRVCPVAVAEHARGGREELQSAGGGGAGSTGRWRGGPQMRECTLDVGGEEGCGEDMGPGLQTVGVSRGGQSKVVLVTRDLKFHERYECECVYVMSRKTEIWHCKEKHVCMN